MISICYEDECFLVLNKPCCQHSVAGKNKDSLAEYLLEARPELIRVAPKEEDGALVQRLDFETSGLILAAKTDAFWQALYDLGKRGGIQKEYRLLVENVSRVWPQSGSHFLGAKNKGAKKVSVRKNPAPRFLFAQTRYELVQKLKGALDLRAKLTQGRRHQVRAQAAFLGFPLIGDALYGSTHSLPFFYPAGFALHAEKISFIHPLTDKPFELTVPPPWPALG